MPTTGSWVASHAGSPPSWLTTRGSVPGSTCSMWAADQARSPQNWSAASGRVLVAAVDPSASFVAAARARNPGVDVRTASAERLPFEDRAFDAALAQLVVHFMTDPVAGLTEMPRVTRRDGVVAACVWDHGGSRGPLSLFWQAARELEPD